VVLDLLRLYAIPLAAAGILGAAVGFIGRRSAVAAAWSLAAGLACVAAAIALADSYLAGARVALWAESGLLMAAAYAAGFAAGAGTRAVIPEPASSVVLERPEASPPPGPQSA
jgi:hypothetical protein